mmetsp:Transcript_36012/g.119263  ORF Transcript_36012/g.119263 Transcript_36012/m.119263 type:complete len:219 (+) Transcript_36012:132-788(+)
MAAIQRTTSSRGRRVSSSKCQCSSPTAGTGGSIAPTMRRTWRTQSRRARLTGPAQTRTLSRFLRYPSSSASSTTTAGGTPSPTGRAPSTPTTSAAGTKISCRASWTTVRQRAWGPTQIAFARSTSRSVTAQSAPTRRPATLPARSFWRSCGRSSRGPCQTCGPASHQRRRMSSHLSRAARAPAPSFFLRASRPSRLDPRRRPLRRQSFATTMAPCAAT